MEKRASTIICRLGVVFSVLVLTAFAAHANLLSNPGFETGTTNIPDSWVVFNDGFRTGTNDSNFGITAHSGAYSLKTFGPFGPTLDASGAYQSFSASAGQSWRLTGYALNWQNDLLSGADAYGVASLVFLDSTGGTGNVLQVSSTPHLGQDVPFPIDTWQFIEVDGVAPAGTATVRAQVAHVGQAGQGGSVWWDDMNLYQPTGVNSTNSVTVSAAVQVSWPTQPLTNSVHYQIQTHTNLVEGNLPPQNTPNFLLNASFDANAVSNAANNNTVPAWTTANGGQKQVSSSPNPTHSGLGALRLFDSTTAVPVVFQGQMGSTNPIAVSPGQVWDFTGYAYVSSTDFPIPSGNNTFGLLKFIWQNASGTLLQPVNPDTNAIGGIVTGGNAGIESAHVTFSSPRDSWLFLHARATAPPNAAFIQVLEIVVGFSPGGAVRFDDVDLTTNLVSHAWKSFGPVIPGDGLTNSTFDVVKDPNRFYRVTTQ
ncbi:MAG TPA: hypothetical protein VNL17_09355 [Verrucomicrobiae bacterium]|nr:hypothetical protein [Verrucomicrobiae bacterium]